MTNFILPGAIVLLCLLFIQPALAQNTSHPVSTSSTSESTLSESQKIEQLISMLRSLEGAVFIRNGSEHTAQEAASHLEAKWQKHGSKIKTAEEFIAYLATKSSMSGEMYMIRFVDGKQVPAAEVLHQKLEQFGHVKHK